MREITMKASLYIPLIALAVATMTAHAQPIERIGAACPPGYYRSGSYCMPGAGYKNPAIPKAGYTCPPGHYQNGKYCTKKAKREK